jgi:hypothetical protein
LPWCQQIKTIGKTELAEDRIGHLRYVRVLVRKAIVDRQIQSSRQWSDGLDGRLLCFDLAVAKMKSGAGNRGALPLIGTFQ